MDAEMWGETEKINGWIEEACGNDKIFL